MAAQPRKKTASKKTNTKSKPAAKKTTAKSVSKKANAKSKVTTADKLNKFNIFGAVSNAVFAVLSVIFLSRDTVSWDLPYGAKDEFASTFTAVFGPAYKTLGEIEIRYILAFIFGLSAVFSLLLATRLKGRYKAQVANSASVLRWIFTGITLGILLELATKMAQINSIITLKTVVALVLVTTVLWVISEQQNKGTKGKMAIFYVSLFTLFLAVMPLIVSLIASGLYGMEWFGWHIYALAFVTIAGLAAMAYSQYKQAKNGLPATKNYLELEGKYLSTDYLIKFSAFIILLVALFK